MSVHDRNAIKNCRLTLFAVASIAAGLAVAGCSELRRAVGMDRVGPDEFAVEARAPLTIPPEFDLRPPQPGAPRPQEQTATDRARRVIDTAGPGEPGKQASGGLKAPGEARGRGSDLDPSQQVGDQSLAAKLLGAGDNAAGTEKRDTKPLKGVY